MGVKFLQGVENFQQGEFLFVQAAYKFLHAAKMADAFYAALAGILFWYLYKIFQKMPIMKNSWPNL